MPDAFADMPVGRFLNRLASGDPTPGGGSVAALVGALAADLGRMACALTVGRKKFADVEPVVQELAGRLHRAEPMLRQLMDEDAAAYEALSAAFKRDKTDPQRAEHMRHTANLAAQVPLETAATCRRVLHDLEALKGVANPNLRSDVEAGILLARAAMHAAAANVRVNLTLMDDEVAQTFERQLNDVLRESPESAT